LPFSAPRNVPTLIWLSEHKEPSTGEFALLQGKKDEAKLPRCCVIWEDGDAPFEMGYSLRSHLSLLFQGPRPRTRANLRETIRRRCNRSTLAGAIVSGSYKGINLAALYNNRSMRRSWCSAASQRCESDFQSLMILQTSGHLWWL
jgi:hypothetical protein